MTNWARRRALIVVALVLLAGVLMAHRARVDAAWRQSLPPSQAAAAYMPTAAGFETGEVDDLVLHDAARNKDLHVKITYPKADGNFPVIIFSHGYGGPKNTYASLTRFWAEHGYVALQPTHDDSIELKRQRGATGIGMGFAHVGEDINDPQQWANRTRDVSFLIDSLGEIERDVPPVAGKLDKSRIGVGGHSFGALTTILIGGAKVTPAGQSKPESFADPRVRALVVMSGSGPGQMGLDNHSWDSVTLPMIVMTGTRDLGLGAQGVEWRKKPYELSKGKDRYFLLLDGGTHMTFTGMPAQAGLQPKILFETVKVSSLAFWDAYLKDSEQARKYLNTSALADFSGGKATLERP
ncbi:MAG: hypothetical protein WCC76_13600 [Candidatus Acidiferrales bacterium]